MELISTHWCRLWLCCKFLCSMFSKGSQIFDFRKSNITWKLTYKVKYISQIDYFNVTDLLIISLIFIFSSCREKAHDNRIHLWKFKTLSWIMNHDLLSWTLLEPIKNLLPTTSFTEIQMNFRNSKFSSLIVVLTIHF